MEMDLGTWRTQVRKGYLELCMMSLFRAHPRLYGFQIIELMAEMGLCLKEGTLYPILTRMTEDGFLAAEWETDEVKGHPRKYYSLTKKGGRAISEMKDEFKNMYRIFQNFSK